MTNLRLLSIAVIVSAGGAFHFGFQLVITNSAQDAFMTFQNQSLQNHYNATLSGVASNAIWSVIVALYFCGAVIGSLFTSFISESLGRKRALIFSYCISFFAIALAVISYFAKTIELYAISRIILGFSNSLSLAIGSLYLSEITPRHLRGRIGMSTGIAVQLGLVVGSLLAMPIIFGTYYRWWIIYIIEAGILLAALILIQFYPESPEIEISRTSDTKAIESVMFFHQCSLEDAKAYVKELHLQNDDLQKIGLFELWRIPAIRRRTIIAMIAMFGAVFSGIAAINAFAVDILKSTGLSTQISAYVNLGLSIVSLLSALSSSLVVDHFGRRPLLLISYFGLFLCNIFIITLLWIYEGTAVKILGYFVIVFLALFLIFFAMGCGPITYFVAVEMCSINSRSAAQAWTSATQMASRTILLAIFLPLKSALGSAKAYLILFILPLAFATIFLYLHLPETKHKTQKELDEDFKRLPRSIPIPSCCPIVKKKEKIFVAA